jgi:hypothetical protein
VQGTVLCIDSELGESALRQAISAAAPGADAGDWTAAPASTPAVEYAIQHGPQQSGTCRAAKRGLPIKQTIGPSTGQLCCGGSAACAEKAATLTFYDARYALPARIKN